MNDAFHRGAGPLGRGVFSPVVVSLLPDRDILASP